MTRGLKPGSIFIYWHRYEPHNDIRNQSLCLKISGHLNDCKTCNFACILLSPWPHCFIADWFTDGLKNKALAFVEMKLFWLSWQLYHYCRVNGCLFFLFVNMEENKQFFIFLMCYLFIFVHQPMFYQSSCLCSGSWRRFLHCATRVNIISTLISKINHTSHQKY